MVQLRRIVDTRYTMDKFCSSGNLSTLRLKTGVISRVYLDRLQESFYCVETFVRYVGSMPVAHTFIGYGNCRLQILACPKRPVRKFMSLV
jgi:hypothetical protein